MSGGLVISGLRKAWGDHVAVHGLDLTIPGGVVVGLVGPNGAGKTTTLRCIAGLSRPTSGTIQVDGFDLVRQPLEARRRIAMVPDVPRLFPYMTVADHIRLAARLYGVAAPEETLAALIVELDLAGRERSFPGELSLGMRQKVAIAAAFVHQPAVVLLDEPLTGLDPVAIRRLKRTLRRRADQGAAILLSSHLLGLVEEIADRVVVLQQGRLVAQGDLASLRTHRPELAGAGLEEIFLHVTGASDG
jgi:ABC-2 type transport system ATP-binding protein